MRGDLREARAVRLEALAGRLEVCEEEARRTASTGETYRLLVGGGHDKAMIDHYVDRYASTAVAAEVREAVRILRFEAANMRPRRKRTSRHRSGT